METKAEDKLNETEEAGEGEPMSPNIVETDNSSPEDVRVEKRPVPDGGWGWFVVLGSTLSQILLGGLEKSRGVIYPELLERFGSNSAITAWVISMTGLLRLCGGPVSSMLANRFGVRAVVMIGGLIVAVSYIASAYVTTITAMFFTYGIIGGIGQMCAYAPSVIIVGLYFDKRRALAAGLSSAGIGIGTFIVPPIVELLLEELGFTSTFFILAGLGLHICISGALFRPLGKHWEIVDLARKKKSRLDGGEDPAQIPDLDVLLKPVSEMSAMDEASALSDKNEPTEEVPGDSKNVQVSRDSDIVLPQRRRKTGLCGKSPCFKTRNKDDESLAKKRQTFFEFSLLKDLPFLSFCVTLLLFTMALQIGQVFITKFARERGVSKPNSALLLSIMGGCDTVGRVGSGFAFDRPKIKPHRQYIYNLFLFIIAAICCLIPLAYNFAAFAGISAALGFFSGTYIAQKSVIIVDLVGADKLVYSFGMIISFQGIGFLIGPTLSGVMIDYFKRYDYSFFFAGAVTFMAGLVFLSGNVFSYRRKQREESSQT